MPVMASVVAEITRAAQADHLGVLMTEMPDPQRLSPILRQREIDGALVFIHSPLDASAAAMLAQQLPVVRVMGGQLAPVDIDHVGPDNNAIGYLAGSYLISRGCGTMAYLTTQPSWDLNKLRAQGFAAAGHGAGVATQAYVVGARARSWRRSAAGHAGARDAGGADGRPVRPAPGRAVRLAR
jgi:DNA-binding LacI/PurR family transcriptional regulator